MALLECDNRPREQFPCLVLSRQDIRRPYPTKYLPQLRNIGFQQEELAPEPFRLFRIFVALVLSRSISNP